MSGSGWFFSFPSNWVNWQVSEDVGDSWVTRWMEVGSLNGWNRPPPLSSLPPASNYDLRNKAAMTWERRFGGSPAHGTEDWLLVIMPFLKSSFGVVLRGNARSGGLLIRFLLPNTKDLMSVHYSRFVFSFCSSTPASHMGETPVGWFCWDLGSLRISQLLPHSIPCKLVWALDLDSSNCMLIARRPNLEQMRHRSKDS